ncbi:MAG: hypothetical protein AVDCRST_MAG70-2191, partial [uncultured Thermomicrobiales bacterium]
CDASLSRRRSHSRPSSDPSTWTARSSAPSGRESSPPGPPH